MMMMNMNIKKIKGMVIKDRMIHDIMLDMIRILPDRIGLRVSTSLRMKRSTHGKNIKTTVTVETEEAMLEINENKNTLKARTKTITVTKKTNIQFNSISKNYAMMTISGDKANQLNGKTQSKEKVIEVEIRITLKMMKVLR